MLVLKLHTVPPMSVELACITPDRLAGRTLDTIARLPVLCGNRAEELGSFFKMNGTSNDEKLIFQGDLARFKYIGAGMTTGQIRVEGSVGAHAGADMQGGELIIEGNAGDWLGAEMLGGRICVQGNAGDQCLAGYRGSRLGVRGGVAVVRGSVGVEAGSRMRRGLLVVGGTTGSFTGADMIAGTIVASGGFGPHVGAGLKRGTLVGPRAPSRSPGFQFAGEFAPAYLGVLTQYLKQLGAASVPGLNAESPVGYWRGDCTQGGRGEYFALTDAGG